MIKTFYNGFEMNFNFNVGQFLFLRKIVGYKYKVFCKLEDLFLFNIKSILKNQNLWVLRPNQFFEQQFQVQWVHPL